MPAQEISRETGSASIGHGYKFAFSTGSYGGGAAYGSNGADGTINGASASVGSDYAVARGAPGGKGADASPPPIPSIRGTGGFGGNGGGGAGACGECGVENRYEKSLTPVSSLSASGGTMTPGKGSDGGRGADGVLLMY